MSQEVVWAGAAALVWSRSGKGEATNQDSRILLTLLQSKIRRGKRGEEFYQRGWTNRMYEVTSVKRSMENASFIPKGKIGWLCR